jgi:hypothetical protein
MHGHESRKFASVDVAVYAGAGVSTEVKNVGG